MADNKIEVSESDSAPEACHESGCRHGNNQGTDAEILVSPSRVLEGVNPVGGHRSLTMTRQATPSNLNVQMMPHRPHGGAHCDQCSPAPSPCPASCASYQHLNNVIQSRNDVTLQQSCHERSLRTRQIQTGSSSLTHATPTVVIEKCQNLQIGNHNTMIVSQNTDPQSDSTLSDSSNTSSDSDSS